MPSRFEALVPEQKAAYQSLVSRMRSNFAKGTCMFPGSACDATPIRSHTISKSNYLVAIAEDNHVLQMQPDYWAVERNKLFTYRKTSLNSATTFPGYCGLHDAEMFRCLDIEIFGATPEQLFMQAYRAHARELYCKNAQILSSLNPKDIERIRGESDPANASIAEFNFHHLISSQVGLRDAFIQHERLEAQLEYRDFRRLRSCVIPFHTANGPIIASAGSFLPDFDALGARLQDLGDASVVLNPLHYSILPGATVSYAVLSFLDTESNGPKQFIDSILAAKNLGDLVVWTAMINIENTVLRPSWWESLPVHQKHTFHASAMENLDPSTAPTPMLGKCPEDFVQGIKTDKAFWI